ncbi:NDP-sugar pyrophosphorylase family protein [Undibacterium sp. GrIS 1.8]|uniref:glycosyltransferase family 2 protein n=1 Tax=Undibacterium sp. GrIS 1.8 TaxID=3143934 RepID=UPI0033930C45
MINILILAAGHTPFDSQDGSYPLCLTEFDGVPLIEKLIQSCSTIQDPNFVIALREQDIRRYHLDNIIELLLPNAKIIRVPENTSGAACTALLATTYIDNDDELLILNGNEILDIDFPNVLNDFHTRKLDAGVVTFPSVHPRYSYVRLDSTGLVVEAAEKNPISRLATVGFYWFVRGKDFIRSVQMMIRKDASVNSLFYICPALNELVLEQARIGNFAIEANQYHPLKTERQLIQFETLTDHARSS